MKTLLKRFALLCLMALAQQFSPVFAQSPTSMPDGMFAGCDSLRVVVLAPAVRTIGQNAFEGADNIDNVYCEGATPPQITTGFSSWTYDNAILWVPQSTLSQYQSASVWKEFKNIKGRDFAGIADVQSAEGISLSFDGGFIRINGLSDSAAVQVYNLAGGLVYCGYGCRIEGLASGAYIIKAGLRTFKVVV